MIRGVRRKALFAKLKWGVLVSSASLVAVVGLGMFAYGEPAPETLSEEALQQAETNANTALLPTAGNVPAADDQSEKPEGSKEGANDELGTNPDGAGIGGAEGSNTDGGDGGNANGPDNAGNDPGSGSSDTTDTEDKTGSSDSNESDADKTPAIQPGLKVESGSITFVTDDGGNATNAWQKIDGKWYYFGSDGQALRGGIKKADSKLYLFDDKGQMQSGTKTWSDGSWSKFVAQADGKAPALTGFSKESGKTYYYSPSTGKTVRWSQWIDGKLYYFNGKYQMHTGWLTWNVDGSKSYFGSNGQAQSGFLKQGKATYYMSPSTYRSVKWAQTIDGAQYYFNGKYQMYTGGWLTWNADKSKSYFGSNGKALIGWQKISGKTYYFDPTTAKAVKWSQKIGNNWYYFNGKCQMHTGWLTWNADKAKSYFDANGRAVTGWQKLGGSTYYFDPATAKSVKWSRTIGGADYYFNGKGQMVTGPVKWKADGTTSVFASNGKMATSGWATAGKNKYYIDASTHRAVKWQQKIGNDWYYFDGQCRMHTGWLKWNGVKQWSYFYSNGKRASGTQKIGNQTFKFDSNGRTKTEPITLPAHRVAMDKKAQQFSSDTSWLILTDRDSKHVGIYRGEKGNWKCVKYWLCCVGKPSTPTITGSYKVSGKGLSFGNGYTCWYYTQIRGNYLFHSVSYLPGSKTQLLDGRLGIANSHGCVRLEISNAKWMYDNVPYGTKIYIY